MIGATVSHYRILRHVGEGGMGVVYEAHDDQLDRTVALKFLPPGGLDETGRARFIGEAQAAARVHHPNICPIYEIGEHDGRLFFAMPLLAGTTASDLIQQGPLRLDRALSIAAQVADGLAAAHRAGIVHRDIKNANIAVDESGHAWILDFGLALRRDAERLTAPGGSPGTPAYMSPEQALGAAVDSRSDLWSLTVALYEMLAARLPFGGASQYERLHAIVHEDPAPVSTYRAGLPERLLCFFDKAFAKDPAARRQSAQEVAAELRAIASALDARTETLVTPAAMAQTTSRAGRRTAAAKWAAVAAALALAAVAYSAWTGRASLPAEKRIAVLPYTVVGGDGQMRALADGLMETITSKLTQVEDFQGRLMVVPSSEIRTRNIQSSEDARRVYGANLALTGSVQRWNNRVAFTQNLVEMANGTIRQIASRSFEFDDANPIAIRDKAMDGAVALLELKLSAASARSLAAGETAKPEAYAAYLKGIGSLSRYDVPGNVDAAIASLDRATQIDPKYALAFAALGQAHWRKAKMTSDAVESQLALDDIQTAIRLNPGGADAHVKLGEIYSETGRSQEAIQQEEAALGATPGDAEAYRALGRAYASQGVFDKAEAAYRASIERQPNDWYGQLLLGLFYWDRNRNGDARATFEAAAKLTPDNEVVIRDLAVTDLREGKFQSASDRIMGNPRLKPVANTYSTLGLAYYYQRRFAEAAAALAKGIAINPNQYLNWGNLGTVDRHIPGNEAKAREDFGRAIELAEKSLQVMPSNYSTLANLAEYYAKLGNKAKCIEELARIPEASRGPVLDRVVLAYELTGDHVRAKAAAQSLPRDSATLVYLRNDPDLEVFWRDPKLQR
jgi:serine/threonine-protein kinase